MCISELKPKLLKFLKSRKDITQIQNENNDEIISFLKDCISKIYLKGFEFTGNLTDKTPSLQQEDITRIDNIANKISEQFWNVLKRINDRKTIAREQGDKIIGASSFDVTTAALLGLSSLSVSLTTLAMNSGIVAATNNITQRNITLSEESRFEFNTVGDSHVCPICDPLDGVLMSESRGNIQEPPLHPNCRCFLIPLI